MTLYLNRYDRMSTGGWVWQISILLIPAFLASSISINRSFLLVNFLSDIEAERGDLNWGEDSRT